MYIRNFKNNLLKDVIRYLNHTVLFIFFIIHDGLKASEIIHHISLYFFFYPDYQTSKTYFFFIYVCLTVCPSSIVQIFRHYNEQYLTKFSGLAIIVYNVCNTYLDDLTSVFFYSTLISLPYCDLTRYLPDISPDKTDIVFRIFITHQYSLLLLIGISIRRTLSYCCYRLRRLAASVGL